MTIAESDLAHWRTWIGKTEQRSEVLDTEAARRFAATLGESMAVESCQPSLVHWAFFLPVAPADQIGTDGHPRRGGFMPPVSLPRRMFAAGTMTFAAPLRLGETATRTSTILDLVHKSGRSGDLVLLEVEHVITQAATTCVTERQTIVYRDAGAATPAVIPAGEPVVGAADALWDPTPVDLFRFSAVTFNGHRIHYDLPYTTGEEGYPGLVVHGPLTAARLFGHASRAGGRPSHFTFRAAAPLFCGQRIVLADQGDGKVAAIRCDGAEAMSASYAH